MIILGLTGQTGAGKTTVCSQFSTLGVKIINCDEVARSVTQKGSPTVTLLAEEFSSEILESDGSLNRKKLAGIAFASQEKTQKLNAITHPAILTAVQSELEKFRSHSHAVLLDAPTLFESGADQICDKIIVVLADKKLRLGRIMARDGINKELAELRMKAQQDDDFYSARADYVIYNNGDITSIREKVVSILSDIGVI